MLHADEVYTPGRKLKVVPFLHGTVYPNVSSEDEILNLSHFSMLHHMGHSTALCPRDPFIQPIRDSAVPPSFE